MAKKTKSNHSRLDLDGEVWGNDIVSCAADILIGMRWRIMIEVK